MQSIGRRLCRFWRNEHGVTALEYAFVAPLFFAAVFMSIEVTFALLADATLERAASQITREGKIGIRGSCGDTVMNLLRDQVSFWADTTNLRADVQVYHPGADNSFAQMQDYQPVCDAGGRGDMVIYRLGFDKPALTGLFSALGMGFFRYERIVLIQNEP